MIRVVAASFSAYVFAIWGRRKIFLKLLWGRGWGCWPWTKDLTCCSMMPRLYIMLSSFHQLFTFSRENKAEIKKWIFLLLSLTRDKALYHNFREFIKTEVISSNTSRTTKFFNLKRPPLKNQVSFILLFNIQRSWNKDGVKITWVFLLFSDVI